SRADQPAIATNPVSRAPEPPEAGLGEEEGRREGQKADHDPEGGPRAPRGPGPERTTRMPYHGRSLSRVGCRGHRLFSGGSNSPRIFSATPRLDRGVIPPVRPRRSPAPAERDPERRRTASSREAKLGTCLEAGMPEPTIRGFGQT